MKHKARDAQNKFLANMKPDAYQQRHNGHKRQQATYWMCQQCWLIVPPYEQHGHLR